MYEKKVRNEKCNNATSQRLFRGAPTFFSLSRQDVQKRRLGIAFLDGERHTPHPFSLAL
jgi:hypothetical protein